MKWPSCPRRFVAFNRDQKRHILAGILCFCHLLDCTEHFASEFGGRGAELLKVAVLGPEDAHLTDDDLEQVQMPLSAHGIMGRLCVCLLFIRWPHRHSRALCRFILSLGLHSGSPCKAAIVGERVLASEFLSTSVGSASTVWAPSVPGEPFRVLCFCRSSAVLPASQSGGWHLAGFVPETPRRRAPTVCRVQVVFVMPWSLRARSVH